MENVERIVTAAAVSPNEENVDRALRPTLLSEYVGQELVRDQLSIFIAAAKRRGEPLDHLLLFGPPGLGKTTLAHIVANEMGVNLRQTSGPVLERPGDLAAILTNLEKGDILFIDEIHRLSPVVEEILYPALEDFQIDIMIGEGPAARSIKLDLPPFTLIGATTRSGMLTNPLRARFGIVNQLQFYTVEELSKIVCRSAKLLNVEVEPDGAREIAQRSRGTPRIANRLLRRVRDYAEVKHGGVITRDVADGRGLTAWISASFFRLSRNSEAALSVLITSRPRSAKSAIRWRMSSNRTSSSRASFSGRLAAAWRLKPLTATSATRSRRAVSQTSSKYRRVSGLRQAAPGYRWRRGAEARLQAAPLPQFSPTSSPPPDRRCIRPRRSYA